MPRDEQVNFRIHDSNRSVFIVEEQANAATGVTTCYRISVDVLRQGVNYFYASPSQYKMFIRSEHERLSNEQGKRARV